MQAINTQNIDKDAVEFMETEVIEEHRLDCADMAMYVENESTEDPSKVFDHI